MENQKICCYSRTYSEIEGLQQAHRLTYCGRLTPEGVVLEMMAQWADVTERCAVLCCPMEQQRGQQLLCYFYENGVDPFQALDVLDELGHRYEML